jgi:predicted nucleic acid-binding Zn ribbon protein
VSGERDADAAGDGPGVHQGPEAEHGPRPLGESLDRVARSLGGPGAAMLGAVFSRWAEVVGPVVADHSWPVSLRRGVLVVGVDEPIWHAQLTYLQADMMERLGSVAGTGAVTRVEVRIRPR